MVLPRTQDVYKRQGFIKVVAGTPEIRVADCAYNARQCIALIREAQGQSVKVLALPELCLTGYTCGDLFFQDTLLRGAEDALGQVLEATRPVDMLVALGLPVRAEGKLYKMCIRDRTATTLNIPCRCQRRPPRPGQSWRGTIWPMDIPSRWWTAQSPKSRRPPGRGPGPLTNPKAAAPPVLPSFRT